MFPRPKMLGRPGPIIVNTGTASAPNWSAAGAVPGDFALVLVSNTAGGTPSGWTATTYAWNANTIVYTKVLTSGDIASPPTFNVDASGIATWALFRNVTAALFKTQHTQSASSALTVTWTPAANSAAFGVLGCVDYSSGGTGTLPSITSPSGAVTLFFSSTATFTAGGALVLAPFTGSVTAVPGSANPSIIIPFELIGV